MGGVHRVVLSFSALFCNLVACIYSDEVDTVIRCNTVSSHSCK